MKGTGHRTDGKRQIFFATADAKLSGLFSCVSLDSWVIRNSNRWS